MTSTKIINFDMDGTIANLYGVENWLDDLMAYNERPYTLAKPLINMQALARVLNNLHKKGYTINIISWLAKNSNTEYDKKVTKAKMNWLKTHLASVKFDNIFIVPYGTPKYTLANGILFDDEIGNRTAWNGIAYDVNNIIEVLRALN